VLRKD